MLAGGAHLRTQPLRSDMRGRGRGRGPARGAAAAPVSRAGTRTRRGDFYEAEDAADPRARRAEPSAAPDAAAGLEELPDDFDDEEIDEDAAFTDADKARWGDLDEYGGGGAGGSGSDEDEEIEWEDGEGDMLAHLDAPDDAPRGGKRVRRAAAAAWLRAAWPRARRPPRRVFTRARSREPTARRARRLLTWMSSCQAARMRFLMRMMTQAAPTQTQGAATPRCCTRRAWAPPRASASWPRRVLRSAKWRREAQVLRALAADALLRPVWPSGGAD